MSTAIQRRRGTTAQHASFAGLNGELTVDTDKKTVVVHDGATAGGFPLARQDFSNVSSLALPAGAAATPVYSFTGDTNTGIYSPGADQVAISTGGSGRLFINSSGKIGVNTSAPSSQFSVGSDTSAPSVISLDYNPTNTTAASISANHSTGEVRYGAVAAYFPTFYSNNLERLRITSAGLVGIGTSTVGDTLHVKGSSTYGGVIVDNSAATGGGAFRAYRNGVQKAIFCADSWVAGTSSDDAAIYADAGGGIKFYTNNSSTAKAVLTSGGSLGIGVNAPQKALHISTPGSTNDGAIQLGGSTYYGTIEHDASSSGANIYTVASASGGGHIFKRGSTEQMRLDASSRLLLGTSSARSVAGQSHLVQLESVNSSPFSGVSIVNNANDGNGSYLILGKSRGTSVGSNTVVQNGDQIGGISFAAADGSNITGTAASISCNIDAAPGTNDVPGRLVFSTTADGASSPTERARIDSSGRLLVGTSSAVDVTSNVEGVALNGNSAGAYVTGCVTASAAAQVPVNINRKTNDGGLIFFWQDGVNEGSITVSGTTVSYNGAHLSRWSQIQGINAHDKDQRPEILRGTVMSNLDEMCDWIDPKSGDAQDNEQLNKTKISDSEGDKNVAGIFQCWDDDDDTWVNDYYLAMTGDFIIRIAEGVTVERGDLLMSAGDGTAKPQDDDIIRSKTIAKVTSTNVSCTYDDGSFCVPCVLMAC